MAGYLRICFKLYQLFWVLGSGLRVASLKLDVFFNNS